MEHSTAHSHEDTVIVPNQTNEIKRAETVQERAVLATPRGTFPFISVLFKTCAVWSELQVKPRWVLPWLDRWRNIHRILVVVAEQEQIVANERPVKRH
jgi:hypothetical protein